MEVQETSQKALEKFMGPGGGVVFLAQDPHYLGDLNDEALGDLYRLLHNEYVQKALRNPSGHPLEFEVEPLKAELVMTREFKTRKISPPKLDDSLTKAYLDLNNRVRKADEKTYEAVTQPDVYDQHIHNIKNMSGSGDGATEEAGTPAHTHNVINFMPAAVSIDGYKSDHPGKVDVKVGKSAFRVTKRDEDGTLHWTADFALFTKSEEQRLVAGIVYEPDIIDAQGDSASAGEILKACHNFMIKQGALGIMHERRIRKGESAIVENFIAPCSYMEGTQPVLKGSWIQVHKVLDDVLWQDLKAGKYTGYSMGGKARDESKAPPFIQKRESLPEPKGFVKFALILKQDVQKVIRRVGDKWCVFQEGGGRRLGCHDSREGAFQQLAAVEANKHLTQKHLSDSIFKAGEYVITQEKMSGVCTRCAKLMKKRGIHKIKVATLMDRNKFKRMFAIRRSSISHDGICRKYSPDAVLFRDAVRKLESVR
jgi:hypothetical protein